MTRLRCRTHRPLLGHVCTLLPARTFLRSNKEGTPAHRAVERDADEPRGRQSLGPRVKLGDHTLLAWRDGEAIMSVHHPGKLGAWKCDLVKIAKTLGQIPRPP